MNFITIAIVELITLVAISRTDSRIRSGRLGASYLGIYRDVNPAKRQYFHTKCL